MPLLKQYQPIEMKETRLNYFPQAFIADYQLQRVKKVERTSTSHAELRFTILTIDNERYELVQNSATQHWSGRKV